MMFDVLVSKDLRDMSEEELDKAFVVHKDGVKLFLGRIPLGCIYATFLSGLYLEIERIVGRAAKGLIVNASRNRGKIAGRAIRKRYEKEFGKITDEKSMMIVRNMITIWGRCFGWGIMKFRQSDNLSKVEIDVENSLEAVGFLKLKEKPKHPVCWMILGYTWGLLEGLFNCRFEGREVKCKAMGDDVCSFVFEKVEY